MKKTVSFIFSFIFLATNVFSDIYLRDSSRYTKFTEKKYITNRNTHICDGEQNIIGAVPSNTRFISFKFAYLKDDTDPALYTFDYLIGYKDGWITTDDIRLENSDILPETIITNNKGKTNKRWIPVWYNSIPIKSWRNILVTINDIKIPRSTGCLTFTISNLEIRFLHSLIQLINILFPYKI